MFFLAFLPSSFLFSLPLHTSYYLLSFFTFSTFSYSYHCSTNANKPAFLKYPLIHSISSSPGSPVEKFGFFHTRHSSLYRSRASKRIMAVIGT